MSNSPQSSPSQALASDPSVSAWVSASAGTGKTHVLTDRVLRLLLAGSAPERILCLTFTKAAAAEMANRIQARLGRWAAMGDGALQESLFLLTGTEPDVAVRDRARGLFARVLDAPGGLKIQTIHAFCQSTLGRFPLEADIAPHFQAMDERTAGESMASARERVLAVANADPDGPLSRALDTVTTLADEDRFAELIATLAADRGRLGRLLARLGGVDGVTAAVRRQLGLADGDTYDSLAADAARDDAFDGDCLRRAAEALATGSAADQSRGATIGTWLAEPGARLELLEGAYRDVFLKKDGDARAESTLATKAVREGYPGVLDVLLAEQDRLLRLDDRRKAAATVASTTALLRLGEALLAAYADEKRRHALLDYDDLVLKTRDLLLTAGTAPWVLYKLDGGLDHILVDEAQDTNPEQWDVVAALADEFFVGEGAAPEHRTVFAVGDAKQSIYSFQRADPQCFADMEDHFGGRVQSVQEIWRPVELVESYRSVPAVLTLVDTVFAHADARDGVDTRHAVRHISNRRGQAGLVELWPAVEPSAPVVASAWDMPLKRPRHVTATTRLARRIAKVIRGWLDGGEVLASTGRPVTPGDIMVLVQRRSTFVEDMVRALKQRGVPVAGVDRMVLTEQLAVMDLVALGRFLLLPADDLTLATVLKGPLIGFDEDALFALAYGRGESTLWDTLKARRAERPDFQVAHDLLAGLLARADFETPYDFYARLLGEGGGRARIVGRLGHEAHDPIDEFLSLALAYERDHAPSLESFLHWLESGQAEVKRDLEQGRDEVRVLTVHGAKGLQAPIVFLPDTCRTPAAMHEPAMLWLDEGGDSDLLLVWSGRRAFEPGSVAEARARMRRARDQEYRRLLYVALTRAADRLYVCGWENRNGRGQGCWYDLIVRAMEGLATPGTVASGEQGLRYETVQTAEVKEPSAAAAPTPSAAALPDWARTPPAPEPEPPRPLAPSRPGEDDPPAASPLDGSGDQDRFLRGVLIHELLEILPDLPAAARRPAADAHLAGRWGDADAAAREAVADEVMAILDHADFAHLFGPDSRAEVPLTGLVDGAAVSGQIDRLVVRENEVIVVDYKSNRPPPQSTDDVAPAYLRQMALYRALLRQIFPDHAIRCVLLWTHGAYLMPINDTVLDSVLP